MRPSVLHFTTTGAIAGTEQAILDLSEAHDRSKWNVSYGTLFGPGEMNRKILANGAPCYAMGVDKSVDVPLAVIRLAKLIRDLKVDVLHTHLVHAGLVGFLAAKLSGCNSVKLVHTRHQTDELYRFGSPIKAKTDAFVANRQDFMCANSIASRAVLMNLDHVPENRIRITYPGVHLSRLRSRVTEESGVGVRRELGISSDHLLIGSVAHLLEKKGHRYLISAMVPISKAFPNARLVIVGRGKERESLEQLTEELGLQEFIHFLGYRPDVPNLINSFDLLAQPSLEEAFGLSMVEGMALGKPIVATNVGGIPEVVSNGETGILVPPADIDALACALSDLLANRAKRGLFGANGKSRAEKLFTIERLATDYESVWSHVLTEK